MHACMDHHSGALSCGIVIAENIDLRLREVKWISGAVLKLSVRE